MAPRDRQEPTHRNRSIRAKSAEWARWEACATGDGTDVSKWMRDAANAKAEGELGGFVPEEDPDFDAALERLRVRYAHRRPKDALRAAVITCRRLIDEAGIDPVVFLEEQLALRKRKRS